MTGLDTLWLPILLSTIIVFIVSSIIHMALPWHKNDYRRIPAEERAMELLRPLAIPPGDYMVPRPSSMDEWHTPEFAEKLKNGPVMMLTVMPNGQMSMARNLVLWFVYCAVVGVFAAYVAGRALPPGAANLRVVQMVGVTAFIAYSVALWQMAIWYRRSVSTTVKATVDGLIYALATAATFAWLWPH